MREIKLMIIASILYVSCINIALAGDECDFYKFSVHNKHANKKIFVKYGTEKKRVEVKPGATELINVLGVGTTKIEIFDSKERISFKGKITKDRSTYGGETPSNRFGGARQIYLAGPIDLSPLAGSVGIESNDSGDCTHNKMGEYTIAVD